MISPSRPAEQTAAIEAASSYLARGPLRPAQHTHAPTYRAHLRRSDYWRGLLAGHLGFGGGFGVFTRALAKLNLDLMQRAGERKRAGVLL